MAADQAEGMDDVKTLNKEEAALEREKQALPEIVAPHPPKLRQCVVEQRFKAYNFECWICDKNLVFHSFVEPDLIRVDCRSKECNYRRKLGAVN